jgi:hypothetical protein
VGGGGWVLNVAVRFLKHTINDRISLREKPVPFPLCWSQIPSGLPWDRNRGGPGSIPGRWMWDLLRTLWQRDRFVSETFGVPLSMTYEHFTCQFTPQRFAAIRRCSASFHANSWRRYVNRKQYQVCTRLKEGTVTVTCHCLRDTSNCLTGYLFNDAQCLKTLPNTKPSNATKHVPYRDTENPSASHEITGFYYIQSFRAVFTEAPNLN